jgi:hypothetical protein
MRQKVKKLGGSSVSLSGDSQPFSEKVTMSSIDLLGFAGSGHILKIILPIQTQFNALACALDMLL